MQEFIRKRRKGRKVSGSYLTRLRKAEVQNVYINDSSTDGKVGMNTIDIGFKVLAARNFKASKGWRYRFYYRWNLTTRRRTKKKKLSI